MRRNWQHRSILTVLSATFLLRFNVFDISETFATFLDPVAKRFTQKTSHRKQETFLYEYPLQ
jgi:hypothetical protein